MHTRCALLRSGTVTRTGICSALQGFRHGSGGAMFRPHVRPKVHTNFKHLRFGAPGSITAHMGRQKEKHPRLGVFFFLVTRTGIEPMPSP